MVDGLASVIIRTKDVARLDQLDRALFSLKIQIHKPVQIIVCMHTSSLSHIQGVLERFKKNDLSRDIPQAHPEKKLYLLENRHKVVIFNDSESDSRAKLLNLGLKNADGEYILILDDDDIIYHHHLSRLIEASQRGRFAIVAGGCRKGIVEEGTREKEFYISRKEAFLPSYFFPSKIHLVRDNFMPIHSYIICRKNIAEEELYFDESYTILEDYQFLLRMSSRYNFSYEKIEMPVCEYRLHLSGANSTDFGSEDVAKRQQWIDARVRICEFREGLHYNLTYADLAEAYDSAFDPKRQPKYMRMATRLNEALNHFPTFKKILQRLIRLL